MARHPWVAAADDGVRWGIQLCAEDGRRSALDRDVKANPAEALLEGGQLVEELGFDAVFIYDHPGQAPDPWIWLSGLATVTNRVRLGSAVNCVYHRTPTYLARIATDLDHLSNGRLLLGLGAGYLRREFKALGVDFMPDGDRARGVAEVADIVRGVWGDEPFSYDGRYYQIENVQVVPPPVQEPWVPVIIGGRGEKTTLRNVATHADACNFNVNSIEAIKRKLDVLGQHCDDVGRPRDEVLISDFTGWLILAPTEEAAQRKLESYFPDGVPDSMDYLGITIGTPQQIIEHYAARGEAGIQYHVVQLLDGSDRETLQMLAEEVVPYV